MTAVRSSLGRLAPLCRESDPSLGRDACRGVWHNTGLIVINPAHLGWVDQTAAVQLAERLYGKRRGAK